jgi:hypothetical protein
LRPAHFDGAQIKLTGLRPRRADEIVECLELGFHVGGEHEVEGTDGRDRGKILYRIERQGLIDGGADRGAVGDEADSIAVGRLRQHRARRRDTARARLIFHHEALPELVTELLRRHAGGDVGNARGGKRQDEPNRTGRISLLPARTDRQHAEGPSRSERHRDLPSGDAVTCHALSCSLHLKAVVGSSTALQFMQHASQRHTFSSMTLARTSSSMSRQM